MPAPILVEVGDTYGSLTIVKEVDRRRQKRRFEVQCTCGRKSIVTLGHLRTGHTTSCGCLKLAVLAQRSTRHGKYGTRTYDAWASMMQRCYNPNKRQFKDWGGRGIVVCDAWHDFAAFYADMGDPAPRLSLDRIDNDGNYEPGNCRWATASQQAYNRRPKGSA